MRSRDHEGCSPYDLRARGIRTSSGADARCLDDNLSSLSAFIRLAEPDDNSIYHLDLNVNNVNLVSYHIDPIDSLQILFDEWYLDNLEYI